MKSHFSQNSHFQYLNFSEKKHLPKYHSHTKSTFSKSQFFFDFQLREEFGYEINPNDPQFADRIAEKEKEMAKAIKAEKKLRKQENAEKYAAQQQEKVDKLAKG